MNHPLTELQIKDKFPGLVFVEKTHTYTVNGKILPSVSSLIKHFHKPFDSDNVAYGYAKKYGFDQKDVLAAWEGEALKATTHGTKVHLFGETYLRWSYNLGVEKKPRVVCKKALGIIQFVNDLPDYVEIIGCEIQMYNERWEYCGTCDILAYNHNNGYYILMDFKGLPVNTPILTNSGWKTMGTVSVGDKVFDKDGELVSIKNKSSIHNKPCYKITFDNGESIVSDHEHKWLITFKNTQLEKQEILTTESIYQHHLKYKGSTNLFRRMRIINPKPLNLPERDLPIDPYVLGTWLGDGSKDCGVIHTPNSDVWDEITRRGYSIGEDIGQQSGCKSRTVYGLITELRKLGLFKNKHIPDQYLLSSYRQRLDLLRGFMDADGFFHRGRKRFVMSTTQLWQKTAMVQLVSSLGWKPTCVKSKRSCLGKLYDCWDICFNTNGENPFLVRNKDVVNNHRNTTQSAYRIIKNVEPVDSEPTVCIEVDSPSSTFLFGDSFIVTHNTNEELTSKYGQDPLFIIPPEYGLIQDSFGKYTCQLSFYQLLLEEIGLNIGSRIIIHLKEQEDKKLYKLYPTIDITKELRNWLENEKRN